MSRLFVIFLFFVATSATVVSRPVFISHWDDEDGYFRFLDASDAPLAIGVIKANTVYELEVPDGAVKYTISGVTNFDYGEVTLTDVDGRLLYFFSYPAFPGAISIEYYSSEWSADSTPDWFYGFLVGAFIIAMLWTAFRA